MWKDVLVQLARHTALRRTFLVDDEVMIFPSTGRQTESDDWRLGAGKMTGVIDALLLDKLRQPSFRLRACDLVYISDYHRTSDPFILARYIGPVRTAGFGTFHANRTTLSGSASH